MGNAAKKLSLQNQVDPAEAIKRDGYVILENCLSTEYVAELREEFLKHMNDKVKRFALKPIEPIDIRNFKNDNVRLDFRPAGGNHDLNRWNMHIPTSATFLNDKIIANPRVVEIIEKFMGPDCVAFLLASDTPYPGSGFQNIHQDFPRFGFTVNIPLVDFTENNAPLEIWPGTHVRTLLDGSKPFHTKNVDLSKDEMQAIVRDVPSQRVMIKAGSILIRDQRMVHRGTANIGNEPRPCLAIWFKSIEQFSLMNLTIPIPHRPIANIFAKYALKLRRIGKGNKEAIHNQRLMNLGNFLGRVVEEFSASDRDYRRVIPGRLWDSFSPRLKHLLRFASVDNTTLDRPQKAKKSIIGSGLMLVVGSLFFVVSIYFRIFRKKGI